MLRLSARSLAMILICTSAAVHAAETLVLRAATVYADSTTAPLRDTNVVVRDGRIAAIGGDVPADARELDCRGLTVVAGLHNNHVHFMGPEWAGAAQLPASALAADLVVMLTRYGFTSVFETGSFLDDTLALRKRIESGEIAGPRILTAGEPLFPPGGLPNYLRDLPPALLALVKEPTTTEAAVAAVDANIDRGADAVKLFTGSMMGNDVVKPMSAAIARAAVAEAHRRGAPVFAHPSNTEGALVAVNAGVDALAHTNSQGWTPALVESMVAHRTALIPTLKLWPYEAAKGQSSAAEADTFTNQAIAQLTAFVKRGGETLFGTDVGYMRDFDPTDEYVLMTRAGMTPTQILASLTTAPASRFRKELQLGRVAVGYVADLAVLDGDPARDITAFARVRYTLRDGAIIYDAGASTPPATP